MELTVLWERPRSTEMRSNLRFCMVPTLDPTFVCVEEPTDGAGSELSEDVAAAGEEAGSDGPPQVVATSRPVINRMKKRGDRFLYSTASTSKVAVGPHTRYPLFPQARLGNDRLRAPALREICWICRELLWLSAYALANSVVMDLLRVVV
jgi:hypothetical protein